MIPSARLIATHKHGDKAGWGGARTKNSVISWPLLSTAGLQPVTREATAECIHGNLSIREGRGGGGESNGIPPRRKVARDIL